MEYIPVKTVISEGQGDQKLLWQQVTIYTPSLRWVRKQADIKGGIRKGTAEDREEEKRVTVKQMVAEKQGLMVKKKERLRNDGEAGWYEGLRCQEKRKERRGVLQIQPARWSNTLEKKPNKQAWLKDREGRWRTSAQPYIQL